MAKTRMFVANRKAKRFLQFTACGIMVVICATYYTMKDIPSASILSTGQVNSKEIYLHDPPVSKKQEKYLIYTCNDRHCGGLADRQKGMITAYLISEITGHNFKISMTRPCQLADYVIPNKVDWTWSRSDVSKMFSEHIAILDSYTFGVALQMTDLRKMFEGDIIYYTGNMDYIPYLMKNPLFQNVKWARNKTHHEIFKEAFQNLFQLSPNTETKMKQFMIRIMPNDNLVCAHIRIGKSRTLPRDNPRNNKPNLAILMKFLKANLLSVTDKLFIATDSKDIRNLFKRKFVQYLEIKGKIIHIDRAGPTYDCSGLEKAVLDQMVLSQCDTLVISNSGFSRVAAIVRGSDDRLFLASRTTVQNITRLNPTLPI